MLQLIPRCPEYVSGYRAYCQEMYDNNVIFFRPTPPDSIDDTWFARTKPWYEAKENGLIEGQSPSFHYWAVDGGAFIGEFQLRTEFTEKVLTDIGSVGYAVRPSAWGRGCGTEILRQGLSIARTRGMEKVLLTIDEENAVSRHVCEKLGGRLADTIEAKNSDGERRLLRRYWIAL